VSGLSGASGALTGFTVGVTCARRADELGALLARRGAVVVHGPAIQLVQQSDDVELLMATRAVVEGPIDIAVASTGVGFRGWLEAAEGWGLGEALINRLRGAVLLARGPKARGAIRAAGLADSWSPESESVAELQDYLLSADLTGLRIAVQLHGEPLPDFVAALTRAGAEVVAVPVYRWALPTDLGPLDRLLELTVTGGLEALTFTSAPAAVVLLERATQLGAGEELMRRLRADVLAVCVGPITAKPLAERGVPIVQPARARLGSMVRELTDALPGRACRVTAAGLELELRGRAVLVNGVPRPLPPAGMALLRALATRPGHVVSRAELLTVLPGGGADEHAVETAVARLRTALGTPTVVQTVVKRGYRLAVA
jgi:uroporphyrinogen-III synthase